jgi:hypothetical protein
MVYGRAIERQNLLMASVRVYHRIWQLYVAHVFLFVMFVAIVTHTVDTLNSSLYAEEFGVASFLDEPGLAIAKALTLQFQPAFMDILPLYIVLMGILPLGLAGFRSMPRLILVASIGLWLAVQFNNRIALPAYPGPDRVWFFNPFAWQALFFVGAWLGWRSIDDAISWLSRRWLFWLAATFAIAAFLIRCSWMLHGFYDPIPVLVSDIYLWPFLSKTDLGPLRFANILALALVVACLIHPQARFLASKAARPFIICGRNSLYIFCLGILLSVLGHLVLSEFFGSILMQCAVSAVGVAIMIGVAALIEWYSASQGASGGRALGGTRTASRGARG